MQRNMLKCALSRWIVPVCCWDRPELERGMLSLVSAGLTKLRAQRNEKRKERERTSVVSAAFYGVRVGVPGQNDMGRSHWMKCMISIFQWQKNSRTK